MLNPDLFKIRSTNMGLPTKLIQLLHDYITNRQAFVDIDGKTSEIFDIPLGCVQGSVLGPIIFSIFMRPINDLNIDLTSYADDTCGLLEIDPKQDDLPDDYNRHIKWLKESGMLVNEEKTEMMVLHKHDKIIKTYKPGEVIIKTKKSMNFLGIIFNSNLTWSDHVYKTISSCQKTLHGLKILRKHFSIPDFTKIATSFLFSKLFYAIEIWHYSLLNTDCKIKLNSFYYKVCRIILRDYNCSLSRSEIDLTIKRARPSEFANYCVSRTVINSVTDIMSPLYQICRKNSFTIMRKPDQLFFFDSSRLKVGKNCIKNRISYLFTQIKNPWLNNSKDTNRRILKKTFFEYSN